MLMVVVVVGRIRSLGRHPKEREDMTVSRTAARQNVAFDSSEEWGHGGTFLSFFKADPIIHDPVPTAYLSHSRSRETYPR
jgi:hypothetical protein